MKSPLDTTFDSMLGCRAIDISSLCHGICINAPVTEFPHHAIVAGLLTIASQSAKRHSLLFFLNPIANRAPHNVLAYSAWSTRKRDSVSFGSGLWDTRDA